MIRHTRIRFVCRFFLKKIIFLFLLSPILNSCHNEQAQEKEQLLKENERLKREAVLKENTIRKFIGSFNRIVDNLHAITEAEKAIALRVRATRKLNAEDKSKITEDVNRINSLILQNKNIADTMRTNFSTSKLNFGELDTLLAILYRQVEEKNNEVNSLKQNLSEADVAFNTFDDLFDKLTNVNVEMETKTKQLEALIEKQKQELSTAYYIVGTYKELKEAGIVAKSGITRIENPLKNFNTSKFIKINIYETTKINTWSSASRIITSHLPGSYKTERNTLVITQPDEFWKITKYLVVLKE